MAAERILEAAEVARELAERIARLRVSRQSAVQATMTLTLAHAYLREYARLLADGMHEDEALVASMDARLDLGATQPMLMRLMFSAGAE